MVSAQARHWGAALLWSRSLRLQEHQNGVEQVLGAHLFCDFIDV